MITYRPNIITFVTLNSKNKIHSNSVKTYNTIIH